MYIYMLSHFSLLDSNVITHSLCVVCVWILWWSRTLYSWEQMIRWMAMEKLMLEDAGTPCSNRMWHWGLGFYVFLSYVSLRYAVEHDLLLIGWYNLCLKPKHVFIFLPISFNLVNWWIWTFYSVEKFYIELWSKYF